ncbi:MAG TPA: iron ABC transporter permease [Candidatus Acetothermia bacterium]|nr:iron ABC transporter permease [Candidatus Bipolaricaulota bacterium]HDJ30064.1 iron ABC transporter permease [Candidatus Acetothermia bacterium]
MRISSYQRELRNEVRRLIHDPVLLGIVLVVFGLLAVFIVLPLVKVVQFSLWPGGQFNPKYFLNFFRKSYYWRPLINSMIVGSLVSLFGTIVAFIFAYGITRTDIPGKGIFRLIAMMPIVSPPFLIALAAILLLGHHGVVTEALHLNWDIYGLPGLVLTETLAYFPIAFMILEGVLSKIDPAIEEAALDMGASKLRTFLTVTLPLAIPGIASAMLLVFIRSLEDFGNPVVIQGNFQVLTVAAYHAVTGMYNMPLGATLAIFMLIPTLMIFVVQKYYVARRSYVTVTGKPSGVGLKSTEPHVKYPIFGLMILLSGVIILLYGVVLFGSFTKIWGIDHTLTLKNYQYVFSVGGQYVLDTIEIALIATPIGGILSMIIAYLVVRKRFLGRGLMEFVSMLNFAVPGVVVGIGYILAFNTPPLRLTGTALIIILVFIFRRMPVGIRDGIAQLQQIDPSIEEASSSLGAGFFRTFTRVTLPLVAPAFLSGLVYIFVRCMTAISAVVFVVSASWQLLTVALLYEVDQANLSAAAAYGYVIIAIVLAAIVLMRFVVEKLFQKGFSPIARE